MKADPPGHIVMTFWRTGDRKKVPRTSKSGVEIRNRSDTKNGNQKGIELLNSNNRSTTVSSNSERKFTSPRILHSSHQSSVSAEQRIIQTCNFTEKKKSSCMYHASESDKMMPSIKTRDKTKKEDSLSIQKQVKFSAA